MITGVGIDIVDVARFRALLSDDLVAGRFLPSETAYCSGRARPWECYAARAAAKHAVLKALAGCRAPGCDVIDVGTPGAAWLEIEIERLASGDVGLRLTGSVLEAAEAAGASHWSLSIAHTSSTALAVVVLESNA